MKQLRVEEFAEVITGGTPSTRVASYWNGDIPWLNSGDLNQGIIHTSSKQITKAGLKNSSARMMPIDSVLIALTGATTGVTALLKIVACANQSVTGILPSSIHIPKYLFYYLSSIRSKVIDKSYGGAQKHISQGFVKKILVPLLPLEEQQHIVGILDKADSLRQKRKQAIKLLDDYLKSVFMEMFGDPANNHRGWKVGVIADLVSEVKYGTSSPSSLSGQYPYLRMNNITYSGELDTSDMKYITLAEKDKEKYLAKKGDLLFNRTNSKELVGKTAVYNLDEPMAIAGYLIRVRTNEKALPEYISAYMNSGHGKKTLRHMCRNIVGMANINAKELQKIKLLIPPMELQEQFKKIVEAKNVLKQKMTLQANELNTQFQALLQKAFKGEL